MTKITAIRVRDYKGVGEIVLDNLADINIICGKNGSGKSSILEGISVQMEGKGGIGVRVFQNDLPNLEKAAHGLAAHYSHQNREMITDRTVEFFTHEKIDATVWFLDDIGIIEERLNNFCFTGHYLKQLGTTINASQVIQHFIYERVKRFKPLLIPPKRNLQSVVAINLGEEIQANGVGILNKLFFLKNQDLGSASFKKYEKIKAVFSEITSGKFNVVPSTDNTIKLMFNTDGHWRYADSCGLGLKDVLVIVALVVLGEYNFYMIEEPENHLHADFQKKLLKFISTNEDKQFLITTHSNVFLDAQIANKIFYCWADQNIKVSDRTSLSKIINSLGYSVSENLTSDAIILLEGPTDFPVISQLLHWKDITTNYNVRFWPLGGDIMASLDLSIFEGRKNVFAIVDSDPGSNHIRSKFEKNCRDKGIQIFKLKKYAVENYFSLDALKAVFGESIPKQITQIEPDKKVDDQLGFTTKKKSIKGKNYEVITKMTLEDFAKTDLLDVMDEIGRALESSMKKEENQEDE